MDCSPIDYHYSIGEQSDKNGNILKQYVKNSIQKEYERNINEILNKIENYKKKVNDIILICEHILNLNYKEEDRLKSTYVEYTQEYKCMINTLYEIRSRLYNVYQISLIEYNNFMNVCVKDINMIEKIFISLYENI